MTMRIALVGLGIRGTLFYNALKTRSDVKLIAGCDISPARLEAFAREAGDIPLTGDIDELLAMRPDAVLVTTPDFAHREAVEKAAAAGAHIMVEKPLATSLADAQAMERAVGQAGVSCMVAFENRWNPPFVAAKNAIDEGRLGDIVAINARLNDTIWVPTSMLSWAARSSPGWFLLSHLADMVWWLSGRSAQSVYAAGSRGKLQALGIDTWDGLQSVISCRDGLTATLTSSWILPESMATVFDCKMEIIGRGGAFYIDLTAPMATCLHQRAEGVSTLFADVHGRLQGAPVSMVHDFVDCLLTGRPVPVPLSDAVANVALIEALHRSAESGSVVGVE